MPIPMTLAVYKIKAWLHSFDARPLWFSLHLAPWTKRLTQSGKNRAASPGNFTLYKNYIQLLLFVKKFVFSGFLSRNRRIGAASPARTWSDIFKHQSR